MHEHPTDAIACMIEPRSAILIPKRRCPEAKRVTIADFARIAAHVPDDHNNVTHV